MQSTFVMTDPQGCPTKFRYIHGSVKSHFKITLRLLPFKLRMLSALMQFFAHILAYWLEFQSNDQYPLDLNILTFPKGNNCIFLR